MTRKNANEFKSACREFLSMQGITALRPYGREVGVAEPTKKNKGELIEDVVAILAGEIPSTPRSTRGAPVKDDFVDPKITEYIKNLCALYPIERAEKGNDLFDMEARLQNVKENERVLTVEDPRAKELEKNGVREIFKGQLETLNGVSMLLPLSCMDSANKIIVSVDMIRAYDLREGDVITCYAEKRNAVLVATTILTINELVADYFRRGSFDELSACYPREKINFSEGKRHATITEKCLEWLVPVGKGQRGLVIAPPKAGKSSLLLEAVRSAKTLNKGMKVFTLLVDQSPENIGQFRHFVGEENLVYTTYEDEPERQVFAADFLLRRAKRYAECGMDILLIVDSFTALAHAFNDTDASTGGKVLLGGMESKTVQYIKRYFGAARCFERGGSITILGSLSIDTGNPADELLKAELSAIGNLEIRLSGELARRRVYPAIDLLHTEGKRSGALLGVKGEAFDGVLRGEYLPAYGIEALLELISASQTAEELEEKIYKQVKNKKK